VILNSIGRRHAVVVADDDPGHRVNRSASRFQAGVNSRCAACRHAPVVLSGGASRKTILLRLHLGGTLDLDAGRELLVR
jgi:hypothetical protein